MNTKKGRIVKAKLGANGKLRRVTKAGKIGSAIRGRVDMLRLNSAAAFAADDDTPVLTRREIRELEPVSVDAAPDVAAVRRQLGLSQGAFAALFGIPLATVKDWEQGRRRPDAPARAYLRVIAQNPKAVRHALETVAE
jgi:putative transcriptional regulator